MFPNATIHVYKAVQGMVDERIERAKHRAEIHDLMRESRARRQFRRAIVQAMRRGLGKRDLTTAATKPLLAPPTRFGYNAPGPSIPLFPIHCS